MKFNWEINLGNLIAVAAMMITLYGFHMSNVKRFLKLEFQVRQMWGSFRKKFHIDDDDFFADERNQE
jgi:hypothetical protein